MWLRADVRVRYARVKLALVLALKYFLTNTLRRDDLSCADLGCGYLPSVIPLSSVCRTIHVYDIDSDALNHYSKYSSTHSIIKTYNIDIEEVRIFGDGSLDLVLAINVLEHLRNPLKVLKTLRKSVSSNSIMIVAVPAKILLCRRAIHEDPTHTVVFSVK